MPSSGGHPNGKKREIFFPSVKPAKTFLSNKRCFLEQAREINGVSAGKAATGRKAGRPSIGAMQTKTLNEGEKIGKILISVKREQNSLVGDKKRAGL